MKIKKLLATTVACVAANTAFAADLEVTHWWTSGGEAAAIAVFANEFNNRTENNWVDGAIAGSTGVALPIITSRIIGGDPMGATQLLIGRQADELIEAGLMLDITDVAEAEGWRDIVYPPSLLDDCTFEGRIYCAPTNIHSWQWMWLSHDAFEEAGVAVPTSWDEFAASASALQDAGIIPLAMGQQSWQTAGAFEVMAVAIAGKDAWTAVNVEHDADVARGPEYARVFEAAVEARGFAAESKVQDWNEATNLVITGRAAAQIMGDWAQGEFQVAGQVAGEDYTCLPGLGVNELLSTGGDAFYFPVQDDPAVETAQKELAALLLNKEVQVDFNLKKGSLPVRGDIDFTAANDCMRRGLEILASGNVIPDRNQVVSPDALSELQDLMVEFFNDPSITAADAQERYAAIIEREG